MDSVGLLVEGVDLLTGASEERLTVAVPSLVEGIHAVCCAGQRVAQVSLPAAHLEILLSRVETELEVKVVSLGRPARLLRPGVLLDAETLAQAVASGAGQFWDDLRVLRPQVARGQRVAKMGRQLEALERGRRKAAAPLHPRAGETLVLEPVESPGFAAALDDPNGLLGSWRQGGKAPLAALLCSGEVLLQHGERTLWRARGIPFLQALELARQAEELLRAVEDGEATFRLGKAPHVAGLEVELGTGALRAPAARNGELPVRIPPRQLAAAMFGLGQGLVVRIVERYRSQAANPYLRELAVRCRAGLAHLREDQPASGLPAVSERPPRPARRSRKASAAPDSQPQAGAAEGATGVGQLRALRFEPGFRLPDACRSPALRVRLGPQGPVVIGRQQAVSLAWDGQVRAIHDGSRGVATLGDGRVLAATADRVLLHVTGSPAARWFRDHDGLPIGPELWDLGDLLLTVSEDRTLLAYCTVTGRELWRLAVPKTVRIHPAVAGRTVILATDSGTLLGLEAADGQRRYQLRSRMGFAGPAQRWNDQLLLTLHAGSDAAVVATELESGEVLWMREGLALEQPTVPCAVGERCFVLGQREGEAHLVCLAEGGQPLWDRALPLGPAPYALMPWEDGVIAMSADGTAARIAPDGKSLWRVGSAGEPQPRPLSPLQRHGVVILPGRTVRAVEPAGGRVLAELETEAPLVDLAVGEDLGLYLLDEEGTLVTHRLVSHLALLATA